MTESLASFTFARAVPSMSPAELRHALKVVAVALQDKAGNMAATDALSDVAGHLRGNSEPQTLAQIALHVALKHGLTVEELRNDGLERDLTEARQEAFWMARHVLHLCGTPRYSFQRIGAYFGGRDASTVQKIIKVYGEGKMRWTQEKTDLLMSMRRQGLSMLDMARALGDGFTTSMVAGKLSRMEGRSLQTKRHKQRARVYTENDNGQCWDAKLFEPYHIRKERLAAERANGLR